ncbi:MAG: DUF3050 domain-containing protein, partial [Gammaproteobacteria bacterium]
MAIFDSDFIRGLQQRLDSHPIYGALRTTDDLRVFMEHHVHSVWDFMSLIKYLQHAVAPARWPWTPGADAEVQRFINELVLEEETDEAPPNMGVAFSSHFMLYLAAMREVGGDAQRMLSFVDKVRDEGIRPALDSGLAPGPARDFNRVTFDLIDSGKSHRVAAALALGREHVIPAMFRAFLERMAIGEAVAPTFHYYLKRHIHLDEDFHAPLSLRLLEALCGDDPVKREEARQAAIDAVDARLAFWDGVMRALP